MLVLMMLAALIAMAPGPHRSNEMLTTIEAEASRLGVPPLRLERALSLPERARPRPRSGPLYCLDETLTEPGEVRRVCRSRADWAELGFEPVGEG